MRTNIGLEGCVRVCVYVCVMWWRKRGTQGGDKFFCACAFVVCPCVMACMRTEVRGTHRWRAFSSSLPSHRQNRHGETPSPFVSLKKKKGGGMRALNEEGSGTI